MNNLVGYMINGAPADRPGSAYNYILAGNGLFISAAGEITAQVPVSEFAVRGLPPMSPRVSLVHGKIPQRFWDLALSVILAAPEQERYVGIIWKGGYQLYMPEQEGNGAHVRYQAAENIVLEMHSHPDFGPGPSSIDDADEQGFKIYGIVGELNEELPSVYLRVGVYGYFMPVVWGDVFEGTLSRIIDVAQLEKEEKKEG